MRTLYWSISLVCAALVSAPLALADNAVPAASPAVVLKAAHIFDSVSGKLADHGVVVVQEGKITGVGANAQIPAGARVIDLGDATLMPGMIDAHVHLDGEFTEDWYQGFYQNVTRFPAEQSLCNFLRVWHVDRHGAATALGIAGRVDAPAVLVGEFHQTRGLAF